MAGRRPASPGAHRPAAVRWVPESSPLARILGLLAGLAGGAGIAVLRRWGNTVEHLARCPLRDATGVPCPTCGGTHALLALARGDLPAAWRENPLVTAGAAVAAAWVLWAVAATLRPGWRRVPALAPSLRRRLARLAAAALLANWIYELARFLPAR